MCNLESLFEVLNELAPLSLSKAMIASGEYDNSGVLVRCHNGAERSLFCLDLTQSAINSAVRNKCDVIVTHHPAIYMPVKSLSCNDLVTAPIVSAIKHDINVISMHLNLDIADGGIDASLCEGLGGSKYRILQNVTENNGYGREFLVAPQPLAEFVANVKRKFSTKKLVVYGNRTATVNKVASFCGAGGTQAEKCVMDSLTDADLIVTSDIAHHQIKELVEKGKSIVILPHYVAEEYGFKKYYQRATEKLKGLTQTYYFDDKRFR